MEIDRVISNDPKAHAKNMAKVLHELQEHLREDVQKIEDLRAKGLFETAIEVLGGLENAMNNYRTEFEREWSEPH